MCSFSLHHWTRPLVAHPQTPECERIPGCWLGRGQEKTQRQLAALMMNPDLARNSQSSWVPSPQGLKKAVSYKTQVTWKRWNAHCHDSHDKCIIHRPPEKWLLNMCSSQCCLQLKHWNVLWGRLHSTGAHHTLLWHNHLEITLNCKFQASRQDSTFLTSFLMRQHCWPPTTLWEARPYWQDNKCIQE